MPTTPPPVHSVQPPKRLYTVVNGVVRWLLSSPRRARRIGQQLMLLHLTGRKSGRRFDLPVAYRRRSDGRLLVLTSAGWRFNLRGGADVEVTLGGHRRPATAELVEDVDRVAAVYRELIEEVGHDAAGRRMGIRINVDRVPTHAELAEAAARDGLSLVYLTVQEVA